MAGSELSHVFHVCGTSMGELGQWRLHELRTCDCKEALGPA